MNQKNLAKWVIGAIALLVLPLILQSFGNAWVRIADLALLYVMLALGLNIVVGYAGLLDLGFIAFYAVGAYTYALLASPQFGLHVPFWLVLAIAPIISAAFGIVLGFPVLRLRGDYLAIVTLGFGAVTHRDLGDGGGRGECGAFRSVARWCVEWDLRARRLQAVHGGERPRLRDRSEAGEGAPRRGRAVV